MPSTHLVVLDAHSAIGALHAQSGNCVLASGPSKHPILECSELSLDHHYFIYVVRAFIDKHGKPSSQKLHIPQHAVIAIYHISGDESPTSIGFTA